LRILPIILTPLINPQGLLCLIFSLTFYVELRFLKQALTKLKQWRKVEPKTPKEKALAQALPDMIKRIEDVLSDEKSES